MAVDHTPAGDLIAGRIEEFRSAYQARDVDGMLELFADGAEFTAAPGTFRGRAEIRRFLEWDARLSPRAAIRDTGAGVLVSGRTAAWERVIDLSYRGIPYHERAFAVVGFDDGGLIRSFRSYYDKLDVLDQITARSPGLSGWIQRKLVGYLVAAGSRGLDTRAR